LVGAVVVLAVVERTGSRYQGHQDTGEQVGGVLAWRCILQFSSALAQLKIPGPPGYWGAGEGVVGEAVVLAVFKGTFAFFEGTGSRFQGYQATGEQVRG
jgi:hypothetical protein